MHPPTPERFGGHGANPFDKLRTGGREWRIGRQLPPFGTGTLFRADEAGRVLTGRFLADIFGAMAGLGSTPDFPRGGGERRRST
jgi:hypothetical protein